jgi:predicted O-methyltransferase YrrM
MLRHLKNSIKNHLTDITLSVAQRTFYNSVRFLEFDEISASAKFIKQHLGTASLFDTKKGGYFQFVMEEVCKSSNPGLWLEFGVRDGVSAKYFAKYAADYAQDKCLYGFDSFNGIRNDWSSISEPRGSFSLHGQIPKPIPNCKFIVGWIEVTLDKFLLNNSSKISFVNFDFDVYQPTKFALERIAERLTPGAIIIFDEFHGYPGWMNHEKKALEEVLDPNKYKFIAFSRKQAAIKLLT